MGKRFLVIWLNSNSEERRERFHSREAATSHLAQVKRIDSCAHMVDTEAQLSGWESPVRTKSEAIKSLMDDNGMSQVEAWTHVTTYGTGSV